MSFGKRQKRFVTVVSIAAAIAICSHVDMFGIAIQPYPETPYGTSAVLVSNTKQINASTEEVGRNCLTEEESMGAELVGEYQNPISTELFQVWKLNLTPHHSVLRVNGLYGTTCLYAYDERYNKTIGDDLSQDDAQQIALVIWRYRANNVGGVEELQASFNTAAAEMAQYGEAGYVSVEDKWALEELGIQVPSIYEIYDPENPPVMRRSTRGDI